MGQMSEVRWAGQTRLEIGGLRVERTTLTSSDTQMGWVDRLGVLRTKWVDMVCKADVRGDMGQGRHRVSDVSVQDRQRG